jgi:16S rRNA (uracil1498-N3)-methyltransferase
VNVILFDSDAATQVLPRKDPRVLHLLNVLKCDVGDPFDAGVINGLMGKGNIVSMDEVEMVIDLSLENSPVALDDIRVIVGLPRPQTARKILKELSSLGAASLDFVFTEGSDRRYARSSLWTTGEWARHLVSGAQQAFTTTIPEVRWGSELAEAAESVHGKASRIALDNYEGVEAMGEAALALPLVIAVGPERGWSSLDREILRGEGFHLVHLGTRVLRVETACTAAYAIAKSKLGMM